MARKMKRKSLGVSSKILYVQYKTYVCRCAVHSMQYPRIFASCDKNNILLPLVALFFSLVILLYNSPWSVRNGLSRQLAAYECRWYITKQFVHFV